MLRSLFLIVTGSVLLSSTTLGCAADEASSPSSASDDLIMLPSIKGSYVARPGTWAGNGSPIRKLELTDDLVDGRLRFHAEIDNLENCLLWAGLDPCPSTQPLDGTYTYNARTLTLSATVTSKLTRKYVGDFDYTLVAEGLMLSRAGLHQELLNAGSCASKDESACLADPACEPVFEPTPCAPGYVCTADVTFERCETARKP